MNNSQKKRLCWNCEGSVSIAEETCPFCGVSVVPAFLEGTNNSFTPPYSLGTGHDSAVPVSPYDPQPEQPEEAATFAHTKAAEELDPAIDAFKSTMLAVIFLLGGSMLFMFGTVLALFSQDGVLTLKWDAAFWYLYVLIAVPMFIFGWRSLGKLD